MAIKLLAFVTLFALKGERNVCTLLQVQQFVTDERKYDVAVLQLSKSLKDI